MTESKSTSIDFFADLYNASKELAAQRVKFWERHSIFEFGGPLTSDEEYKECWENFEKAILAIDQLYRVSFPDRCHNFKQHD